MDQNHEDEWKHWLKNWINRYVNLAWNAPCGTLAELESFWTYVNMIGLCSCDIAPYTGQAYCNKRSFHFIVYSTQTITYSYSGSFTKGWPTKRHPSHKIFNQKHHHSLENQGELRLPQAASRWCAIAIGEGTQKSRPFSDVSPEPPKITNIPFSIPTNMA